MQNITIYNIFYNKYFYERIFNLTVLILKVGVLLLKYLLSYLFRAYRYLLMIYKIDTPYTPQSLDHRLDKWIIGT